MSDPGKVFFAAALIPLVALSSLATGTAHRAPPRLWAGLSPGPYAVGYELIVTDGERVDAWYPTRSSREALRFSDYLEEEEAQSLSTFLAGTGIPVSVIDSLFDSQLFAGVGSSPLDGSFPLVLVAQGNGQSVIDQVVLCEYLASQGYVVATTPSPTRETPLEREDQVGAFAERQADDLADAVRVASSLHADTQRIAVVGHSFGARAALLVAMRDRNIRALVSLDGGIGTATAVDAFRTAPSFDPGVQLPPILHFYEELDAFMTPDFSLLESLRAETLELVPTAAMHHVHFTTYGFAAAAFPAIAEATRATPDTGSGVRTVIRRTAAFLADYFAGGGTGAER
jgi:dienelactone hydrolase